jgi:hypothetical protein
LSSTQATDQGWLRDVAARHGITKSEIDRMASAFEHKDLKEALGAQSVAACYRKSRLEENIALGILNGTRNSLPSALAGSRMKPSPWIGRDAYDEYTAAAGDNLGRIKSRLDLHV